MRHVLYLDGAGRETPYLSATETHLIAAEIFAGPTGRVWTTTAARIRDNGAAHRSRTELLSLLKGNGKGDGKWHSPFEIMQARRYVEEWQEHLADFTSVEPEADIEALLRAIFV